MCGLCGMFGGGDHWTDQSGTIGLERAAERRHRVAVANAVLEPFGVRCAEWQGRLTVSGRTGRSRASLACGTSGSAVIIPTVG